MNSFSVRAFFNSCLRTVIPVLLLAGCSPAVPPAQYRAYLADPEHGLTHSQVVNGADITCSYRPIPLLVLQDLTHLSTATAATRDSLSRAYAGKTYCSLSLARNGGEIENKFVNDPSAYRQAITYLNSGIAADTYLATGSQDSVAALSSMYLRQYGSTGRSTVLLVFNTSKLQPERGFTLTVQAQRLGLGTLRFSFTGHDLAALPELQFN